MKTYPVLEPVIGSREKEYVLDCMESGWVSSWGKYIGKFEETFARYVGVRYARTTCNGTVSLHLVMLSLGIGKGDEVIVPNFTYAASANAVLYVGAAPVFVDCEESTFNIDVGRIEERITPRTKAIMPVHLYGNPCRMEEIMRIARQHRLMVIEDAAEAHGAFYKNKMVGSFGVANSFSFFGNKTITTGEGGMVVTNSKSIAARVALLKNQAQPSNARKYYHPVMGYNYRMTNLQAALGLGQLERIKELLERKRKIRGWYEAYLEPLVERGIVTLQEETPGSQPSWWVNAMRFRTKSVPKLALHLRESGVDTRPFFLPMSDLPYMRQHGHFPHARRLARTGLILPSGANLEEKDIALISDRIKKVLK
ncbi:MAG: perosamine synthetase [Parcubacteria group bacterium Gr01-1014_33]|nr:MAG: perosamine synthetase [Parcubacteria group bacterium Gr01-1014_33]